MSAAAAAASEPIDSSSLQALMIRWKLAEQFLFDNPEALETGKNALQVLVSRDFPTLIHELVRLRPELVPGAPQDSAS